MFASRSYWSSICIVMLLHTENLMAFQAERTTSIWTPSAVPTNASASDTSAYELGVKFRTLIAGKVTGVRFYKGPKNTGTHTGSLWTSTGTRLATATFTGETATGWQSVFFPTPVSISPGVTYIASYHTPTGGFAHDGGYFASNFGGQYNEPLVALASGVDGGNGVYSSGASAFPSQTYNVTNYWVDVIFSFPDTGATTRLPSSTVIESGTANSGSVAALSADDNSFHVVNSTTSGSRQTSWYGSFTNVPKSIGTLSVTYKGKNSVACTEVVSIYNWATNSWAQLSSSNVSSTESLRALLPVQGAGGDYVSGTSGSGEVRVRVQCTASANFTASGELLTLSYTGGAPRITITSPSQNQVINGTTVAATYVTTGDLASINADHAHITLDTNAYMMEKPLDGTITFSNVPAGAHTLKAFLVRGDHSYIEGTDSPPVSFSTVVADTVAPTISITNPPSGASVTGTVNVTASASDNVAVAGVQFLLDGNALGPEDTSAPYSFSWNTATSASGQHTLTARARDTSGNTTVSPPVGVTITGATDPSVTGQWSPPANWPVVAIHVALMYTGEVLAFEGVPGLVSGSVNGGYWNPTTGAFVQVPDPSTDIFCASLSALPDGRVLVVGGHGNPDLGTAEVNIFDPATHSWSRAASMAYKRWYPTSTTLADGRVLATGGAGVSSYDYIPVPEIYNPTNNTWTKLPNANLAMPTYPHMFLMANGKLAYTGNSEFPSEARLLDPATQVWSMVDPATVDGGSSVMYEPGKFLKSGSANDQINGQPSAATAYTIDFNSANPRWQQVASMAFPRTHHVLTLLPDGNVLATSGTLIKDGTDSSPSVYEAELWSPVTRTWTTLARATIARKYHTTALLLPDGRVLVGGTGRNIYPLTDQRNYELFSPPYLFKGQRPTIASAPATIAYGSSFSVGTPEGSTITSAVLMRPGAMTHMFDMEQRRVPLSFSQTSGGLTVQAPANGNIAPPGYYLLFLLNANGVPSIGRFVRLPAPYEDAIAPTAPTSLTASGSLGTATLNWTAATDNQAVVRYNVHRSTTAGFTPAASNRVAQPTGTTYTDSGLTSGRHYYRVTAEDANGNIGPASNEAAADVLADTAPPSVSITSPSNGTTVSDTITLTAEASDAVGVAGVQFLVDGNPVGSEDPTSPYSTSWNSKNVANGTHQIAARARDLGGNTTTSTAVSVNVANTTVTNGLVAAYSFNETSGLTVQDASGNNNAGSISGAARVPGKYGNGLSFNGTSNMVSISASPSLNLTTGMTLEAWVNPSANSGFRTVIMKEIPNHHSWALESNDDLSRPGVWVYIGNTTSNTRGVAALPLNTWTHIAGTYDGSVLRFYVNGTQVNSLNLTGTMATSSNAIRIGGNSIWNDEFFAGLIDEVRIYNRALSQAEIQADMNTPIP
jgi:hypothetical protein